MHNDQIERWFCEYANDVYNFLVYFTGSRDVEDLVQETFTKALLSNDNLREISSPKSWLFSIAKNTAIDQSRRKRFERVEADAILATVPMPGDSVEDIISQRDFDERIVKAIGHLKPNHRAVFLIRLLHGFSVEESAVILGWSQSKVKTTLHRAIQDVKKQIGTNKGGWVDELAYR